MLTPRQKNNIIKRYAMHKGDTGSPEVQISLLTYEIEDLTKHLKNHKKDFSSRKGLLGKVAQRKKILKYLKGEDEVRYEKLIKKLKIKK
jgi:small subunit ribosomal protein S15